MPTPTAADRLQSFMAGRPADAKASDFDLDTSQGRRLYNAAKQDAAKAQSKWDNDNKDTLSDLRGAVKTENASSQTGLAGQQRREAAQTAYQGSPDQRFMGWAVPGAVPAGTALGTAESYLMTKHLPANRASLIPFAIAALGQGGKAADLYSQLGNPDASPYAEDQKRAMMNGLASAGITDLGGMAIQNAIIKNEQSRQQALADMKPQVEAIKTNSLNAPPSGAPLSPQAQKTVDFAKKMGAPDTALASHEGASSWLKSEYDRGLTNAQEDLVRQARSDFGMAKNASYGAVLRKFAPAAAVSAGLVSAFAPDTAHAATQAASDLYQNYMPPPAQRAISTVSNAPEFGAQRGEMVNNMPPAMAAQEGAYRAAQAQTQSAQEESRYRRLVEALQSQAPDNMYGVRRYLGQ